MKERYKGNVWLPLVFAIILCMGLYLGSRMGIQGKSSVFSSRISHFSKLNEVVNYIEQEYVDTVNEKQLVDQTITEILSHLDPHSSYIPSEDLQAVNESLEGKFDGIGIEFHVQEDTIMVVSPVEGGPSFQAGIKSGDRIVTIDGKDVAGKKISNSEVVERLRGASGTVVSLGILRRGKKSIIPVKVTRGKIPIYSVDASFMVEDTIGYIRISRFAANTFEEFLNACEKLKDKGMRSLILDLQGNPGGYLNAATQIADEFLPAGKLMVYTKGRSRSKESYYSTAGGAFEKGSVYVLIDEGSASASEILSGAIQDLDRGLIIGRRSFGKGLVQEQSVFPDGSAIRLTIARYYTPAGRCIQKSYSNGIEQYNDELLNRMKRGELDSPDSIKLYDTLTFKTAAGRTVYGGGGIMPDVFVARDTTWNSGFIHVLFNKGYINEFALSYADKHREMLSKYKDADEFNRGFVVKPEILKEFYRFAEKNHVEKDSIGANSELAVKTFIKASIARQIWKNEGYYRIRESLDPTFRKALELAKEGKGISGSPVQEMKSK